MSRVDNIAILLASKVNICAALPAWSKYYLTGKSNSLFCLLIMQYWVPTWLSISKSYCLLCFRNHFGVYWSKLLFCVVVVRKLFVKLTILFCLKIHFTFWRQVNGSLFIRISLSARAHSNCLAHASLGKTLALFILQATQQPKSLCEFDAPSASAKDAGTCLVGKQTNIDWKMLCAAVRFWQAQISPNYHCICWTP